MARINIEDSWWTDPRREKLSSLIGNPCLADGVAIRMWRLAQEFWKDGRSLIPPSLFDSLECHEELIQAGLAERTKEGVYVRGTSQYHEWVNGRAAASKKGGKKSVEARRVKYGSAQPSPRSAFRSVLEKRRSESRSKPEAGQSKSEAKPKQIEAKNTQIPEAKPKQIEAKNTQIPEAKPKRIEPSSSSSYSSDSVCRLNPDPNPSADLNPIPESNSNSDFNTSLNTQNKKQSTLASARGDSVASVDVPLNNLTSSFIATYVNAYQERYGKEARPSLSGRVRGQIITLLKETPLKRACALITHYCQMDDGWFRTKGHDFSTFVENLTKVGLSLDTGVAPDRKKTRAEEISAYNAEMDAKILRGEV